MACDALLVSGTICNWLYDGILHHENYHKYVNSAINWSFVFQNNPTKLDLSYEADLDL